MTQIDFYILPESASESRWLFACRLVEKAVRAQHKVLIALDSEAEAQHLDQLLWSFKPETFIPHELATAPDFSTSAAGERAAHAPVVITTGAADHQLHEHHGLLINLATDIPSWFSRFERLSEIVIQQPEILKNTREHFSFYRQRGYPIKHHKL
jgi:DNA polymerase-3 subunit chi